MATSDALALLDRLYDTFRSGDAALWEESIADDAVLVGTDPSEFWTDAAEAKVALRAQLTEMKDAGVTFRPGEPISRTIGDDAVLVIDRPIIALSNGGEQQLRLSVLFTGPADSLRIQHFHLSVPATNEDVLDTTLTT